MYLRNMRLFQINKGKYCKLHKRQPLKRLSFKIEQTKQTTKLSIPLRNKILILKINLSLFYRRTDKID